MTERRELPLRLLTAEENLMLQERVWSLLVWQTARYTMGDSTSVPAETARALLESIRVSLELYIGENGLSPEALLREEPEGLLRAAETAVRRQVERARLQYARARRCRFQEESAALTDTLTSVSGFFRDYDARYFAAELPCDIDYQLCHPVPEETRGVLYLREYLRRLLTEDAFLRRFDPAAVRRLLSAVCPTHRELLVNLYEPVADAALGLTLTEGALAGLDMTAAGQGALTELLSPRRPAERLHLLDCAAQTLARRLELPPFGAAYLRKTARGLHPRMEAVLEAGGSWQACFPAFS